MLLFKILALSLAVASVFGADGGPDHGTIQVLSLIQ